MNRFRFFIDIKALAWAIVLVVILNEPLGNLAVRIIGVLRQTPVDSSLSDQLYIGFLGSVISTVLIALVAAWWYPRLQRHRVTGNFKAFEVQNFGTDSEAEAEWGEGKILFDALSLDRAGGVPVKVMLTHSQAHEGKIELLGSGLLINNCYLVGFYTEMGKPERRRAGGFCYRLRGDGNSWEGHYSYISPVNDSPAYGYVRWKRA